MIFADIAVALCTLPVGLFIIFFCYPKNWQKKKIFYGIRNREAYLKEGVEERISALCDNARKNAFRITCVVFAFEILLIIFHNMPLNLTINIFVVYAYILLLFVPYAICNKNIKSLKRELKIGGESGVSFTDISNASVIRAVKAQSFLPPILLLTALFVFALLVDFRVVTLSGYKTAGSFLLTIMTGVFFFVGVIMVPIAYVMDRQRNLVISEDSTVNANYNRATKKCIANINCAITWMTVFMAAGCVAGTLCPYTETVYMIISGLFMVGVFGIVFLYMIRMNRIEERYKKDVTLLEDDDDRWILGLFYYNPKDRKLNVEKRIGVGSTVNMAHPVGKLLGVIIGLVLIGSFLCIVWMGFLEATPIRVSVEDGKVICHQLRNDYVIDEADIRAVELVRDLDERNVTRIGGVSMPELAKGKFDVGDDGGCRLFLNPEIGVCIRIETADRIYYISAHTEEDTMALYEELSR